MLEQQLLDTAAVYLDGEIYADPHNDPDGFYNEIAARLIYDMHVSICKDAIPNGDISNLQALHEAYDWLVSHTFEFEESELKIVSNEEYRKNMGIVYTPDYIVNYIVENTVGQKLKDRTLDDIGENLSILDPACGTGLFLVEAYQHVLNWYLEQYVQDIDRYRAYLKRSDKNDEHGFTLTIDECARILNRHIYGVDLDENSVLVTRLSLELAAIKFAEGMPSGYRFDLSGNIKCGNSLIGSDYYDFVEESSE